MGRQNNAAVQTIISRTYIRPADGVEGVRGSLVDLGHKSAFDLLLKKAQGLLHIHIRGVNCQQRELHLIIILH
jgi:hypothetical protein